MMGVIGIKSTLKINLSTEQNLQHFIGSDNKYKMIATEMKKTGTPILTTLS